ncbi:MAG: ABC transporter permease [Nitrososphaerales archaeon]
MIGRVASLFFKELIQLERDRRMLLLIVLFPVVQLVLLAGSTGRGINDLSIAVVDQDRTAASRRLILSLDNTHELNVAYLRNGAPSIAGLVQKGQVLAAVVVPPGYGAALEAGRDQPQVQLIVDGASTNAARTAAFAVEGVVSDQVTKARATLGYAAAAPVRLVTTALYNAALNSRLFTIPAQMGFIIYQVTLAVAALVFARERELGTLEGLLVTPLRRLELITGKASLAWLIGVLDFLVMVFVVQEFYAVPLRGSFGLLLFFSMLFVAVEICFGVILSSFARTQQQAILYVFVLAMLDIALSGYLAPVNNMPPLFATLAQASPLQHYLVAIRGIMLKGAGLDVLWPQALALLAIGAVMGGVAVRTATSRLE